MLQGRQGVDELKRDVTCDGFEVVALEHRCLAAAMVRRQNRKTGVERERIGNLLDCQHAGKVALSAEQDDEDIAIRCVLALEVDETFLVALSGEHARGTDLPSGLPDPECSDQFGD